jgi:flagellar hook protein FlgE
MLDSVYIGMTGLMSFSKGLTAIGNNVANLNTVGFKGSELGFLDLYYRYSNFGSDDQQSSPYAQGSGVATGSTTVRFTAGQTSQTSNDLDVAIDGNGFFILNQDGKTLYTRAGQFEVDDAGYLTSRDDGARVYGISGGALSEINISGQRSNAAHATSTIKLQNSLTVSDTSFDVSNITVYDSLGVKHQMTLHMVNNTATTPGSWTFTLLENSATVASGEVRYSGSGTPQAGYETTTFSYDPHNGATARSVTLDFTNSNSFSSASSNLSVASQDGYAAGFLTKTAIDADGNVVLTYSNSQTVKSHKLALAWFDNLSALQAEGNKRFAVFGDTRRLIGAPGESSLGALKTASVELSNVDLAKEFSELIIVQRGYQASSQIISAANEMIQQLGDIRGRR